jgi:hypothetical protein
MQVTGWKRWGLGLVGTIVVGALGSGVWDLALKPSAQWMGQLVLTAVTLGSGAMKDQIYREAAKGFHEAAALEMLIFLNACLIGGCGGFAVYTFEKYKSGTRRKESPYQSHTPEKLKL